MNHELKTDPEVFQALIDGRKTYELRKDDRGLALAAALAMAMPMAHVGTRRDVDWFGHRQEPTNTGRRAEKDAIALAKAEAKRKRKMAKRATGMPPNA